MEFFDFIAGFFFWFTDSSRAKKFSCYVDIRLVALKKDTGKMYEDETALSWLQVIIFEAYRFRAGTNQSIPMWTTCFDEKNPTSVGMVIVLKILWYDICVLYKIPGYCTFQETIMKRTNCVWTEKITPITPLPHTPLQNGFRLTTGAISTHLGESREIGFIPRRWGELGGMFLLKNMEVFREQESATHRKKSHKGQVYKAM